MEVQKQSKPWYKRLWIIIPLGILIMPIAMIIVIATIYGIVTGINDSAHKQQQSSQVTEHENNSSEMISHSKVQYKSVEAWQIGDNGRGMTIVIDKKYDNEASLAQLGKELNEENASRQFAMVYIYNDDTASLYRKESFCAPGQPDRIRSFKQNWAAMYQKNLAGASYTIFTDRSCNPNATSNTVNY